MTAGPVVVSTDSDYDTIHNLIPYEYAYGSTFLNFLKNRSSDED